VRSRRQRAEPSTQAGGRSEGCSNPAPALHLRAPSAHWGLQLDANCTCNSTEPTRLRLCVRAAFVPVQRNSHRGASRASVTVRAQLENVVGAAVDRCGRACDGWLWWVGMIAGGMFRLQQLRGTLSLVFEDSCYPTGHHSTVWRLV
jgi:hypothetical protein